MIDGGEVISRWKVARCRMNCLSSLWVASSSTRPMCRQLYHAMPCMHAMGCVPYCRPRPRPDHCAGSLGLREKGSKGVRSEYSCMYRRMHLFARHSAIPHYAMYACHTRARHSAIPHYAMYACHGMSARHSALWRLQLMRSTILP